MKYQTIIFLAMMSGAWTSQAQDKSVPVDVPKYIGGESWEYKTTPRRINDCNPNRPFNTTVTIESVDESGIIARFGNRKIKMTLGLDELQEVNGVNNIRKTYNFPIENGKKWDQRMLENISSGVLQTDVSCEHGKFEKLTVPAGEFDSVPIICKGRWNNLTSRNSDSATYSYWYSPVVKNIVKREVFTYFRGNVCADTETVLLKFQELK